MRRTLWFALVLLIAWGCAQKPDGLKNGDLIFVGIPYDYEVGSGSMSEAITAATGGEGPWNMIHVAIAEVKADSVWIIDATIARDVARRPLDVFLKDFTLKDGSYPEFLVRRVKGVDADAAVERAKEYVGRHYDFCFDPDNEDIYCSELVQITYLDKDGNWVFESQPMNFLAPDGTMPRYWEWLFDRLGMEIPQGVPGTNPQNMFEAPCLTPVSAQITQ